MEYLNTLSQIPVINKKKWLSQKSFSHSLRMSLVLKYRLKSRPLGGGLAPWVEWDTNMPQGHHRSFPACFSPYSIFPSFPICLTEKQNFHRLKLNLTQVQLCQCNNDICCRTDARIKKYKIKINLPSEYNAKILPLHCSKTDLKPTFHEIIKGQKCWKGFDIHLMFFDCKTAKLLKSWFFRGQVPCVDSFHIKTRHYRLALAFCACVQIVQQHAFLWGWVGILKARSSYQILPELKQRRTQEQSAVLGPKLDP